SKALVTLIQRDSTGDLSIGTSCLLPPASCRLLLPPASCSCFLLPRCGRRSFLLSLAKLHNPQAGVNVVEINQPVLRLRAPAEWQVRTIAFCVSGPEATDFASL